jgi:hypothetical protein
LLSAFVLVAEAVLLGWAAVAPRYFFGEVYGWVWLAPAPYIVWFALKEFRRAHRELSQAA